MHQYLLSVPDTVCVHTNCRKYYDLRKLKRRRIENTSPATSRTSHSDASTFKWKTICFLCCEEVDVDNVDVHCARTLLLRDNLLRNCAERGDSWAVHVKKCLDSSNDSVAEEAMYHRSCYIRFKQGRDITVDNTLHGRPADSALSSSFEYMCEYLESSDCEMYTLEELRCKIIDDCGEAYSNKRV